MGLIIDNLFDECVKLGKKKSPRLLYQQALFFNASILLNSTAGQVLACDGSDIKFYGISVSGSSSGKDFSFNEMDKLVNLNESVYAEQMKENLELNLTLDGYDDKEKEKLSLGCPNAKIISAEGTGEGLTSLCRSQSVSTFGSINLIASEIGDIINNSSELINKIKEMWDRKLLSKSIKSENEKSVYGISSNILLFGSADGVDLDAKKTLMKALNSGLYRRCFVVNIPAGTEIEMQDKKPDKYQDFREMLKSIKTTYVSDTKNLKEDYVFESTIGYLELEQEINKELITEANENQIDKYKQYDSSAITIITKLAHIVAFLESTKTVNEHHLQYAYDYFKETRATLEDLLYPNKLYIQMYQVVKMSKERLSYYDLTKYISDLPDTKSKRDELIELFQEYAFYKGDVPEIRGNKVKYFSLREPEETELDKLVVSLDMTDYEAHPRLEPKQAIAFQEVDLSFFDNGKDNFSLEKVVQSKNVKSFCLSKFEESDQAGKQSKTGIAGHRRADNYIEGFNVIGIDIDEGMTIEKAQELLSNYTYLIYTTRSHRSEKNGEMQGDRFRVLLPLKQMVYVDPERYKKMYENAMDFLGIKSFDKATRNVSRLWFTNSEAEIFTNEGLLFNISPLVPDTAKSEIMLPNLNQLNDEYSSDFVDETERRLLGMKKYVLLNTSKGNRSVMLYNFACFCRDIGANAMNEVYGINSMLTDPLSDMELDTMLKGRFN